MSGYPDRRDVYVRNGIAIINPYGGIWTGDIFKTPEEALSHLRKFWGGERDLKDFKLAMATQTVTLDRQPGEPTFIELPAHT